MKSILALSCALLLATASFLTTACDTSSGSTPDAVDRPGSADVVGDAGAPDVDSGPPTLAYFDQCVPGEVPDEACYAKRRAPSSTEATLALAIARRYMEEYPPGTQEWNWEEGVMMYAFTELYRVTGAEDIEAYYRAWIDHHVTEGYRFMWSDSCPPVAAAISLHDRWPAAGYEEIVRGFETYVYDEAPRSPEGGLSHLGIITSHGSTLWLDTLFMVGIPLLRWAEVADDTAALDELTLQLRVFSELLQDESGWYTHATNWQGQEEGVFWARGNSWVTVALAERLRHARLRGESMDDLEDILAMFERQSAAIRETQAEDTGLWWTLPSHPGEGYQETSGSALFAYGLARAYRFGYLDDSVLPVVAGALKGVRGKLRGEEDGRPVVTGTSLGTTAGDKQMYLEVELDDDVPYGVGAAILLLLETSGLPSAGEGA